MKSLLAIFSVSLFPAVMAARFPPYSWDSHIHVIDPERFPMDPDRGYTPKPATVENATEFEEGRGIDHAVVVLPSVYGTDNSVLLDALKRFEGRYRGVAVVDPDTVTNDTLRELHEAGVRGLRVNAGKNNNTDEVVTMVKKHAAIARIHGWTVEIWVQVSAFTALHSVIPELGVMVVADHFAHSDVGSKTNNPMNTIDPYKTPGFREVVDLIQRKILFVKLTAPYRTSNQGPLYEDMRVAAEIFINAGPEMVVYGSDWPHTASEEGNDGAGGRLVPQDYRVVNVPALAEIVKDWAGSEAQIQRIFVDNPRRLWQWYEDS